MSISIEVSPEEKSYLFQLIRWSIVRGLQNNPIGSTQEIYDTLPNQDLLNGVLGQNLGAFVTLHIKGNLRGCIGNIVSNEPLILVVAKMAYAAAFQDYRFGPLVADEYPLLDLELSILESLTLCPNLEDIEVGKHGLLLQYQDRQGVFLPQVPTEQNWTRDEYLNHLCLKASVPIGSQFKPEAKIFWYEALVLHENN